MTTTTTEGRSAPHRCRVGLLLQRQGALIALVVLVVFGTLRYGENFATGFNLRASPATPPSTRSSRSA